MEEVINQLKTEVGLTEEQAVKAMKVLKGFLDKKVPPMFSGVVDKFSSGLKEMEDDVLG